MKLKTLGISNNAAIYLALILPALFIMGLPIEVQAKLSDIVKNVGSETTAMAPEFVKFFGLGGFVCIGIAIVGFMTRKQNQIPMGVHAGFLGGGIVLLAIVQFAGGGLESVFGNSNNSGLQALGLSTTGG